MRKLKFKIGYFADGPWSHRAFEKIIKDNTIKICFIVPRIDTTDSTLSKFALDYNIDYLYPMKVNTSQFIEKAKTYDCDLFVSMSFDQIFKQEVSNLPRLGIINCHAGKLPFYRGRNILTWALINDEKEFGITVHFIDEGIDTGDVIIQSTYPINDMDNYSTLLEKAYDGCSQILFDSIKKLQQGNYQRIKQSEFNSLGMYCGKRGPGDETINWNSSSRDLFNFIRSISTPGPKATTSLNGVTVKINKAIYIPEAPIYINNPGQLLAKTENGFYVKTKDSFIEISEIETSTKLKVGDRLGR